METSAEIAFAQRLASNEKTIRDRALKKLRKYISARASKTGFSNEEFRKLWKGLHYSMWMQDKPLLQEELSARICGLLKAFSDGAAALRFAAAFFATQANEWNRLDQWRMDKYMMLTRDFLHATFEVLKNNGWEQTLVSSLSQLIQEEVMDAGKEENPDGLRLHLADIYLEELAKVGADQITGDAILTLLHPFIVYIVTSKRDTIVDRIMKSIFKAVLKDAATEQGGAGEEQEAEEQEERDLPKLKYDYKAIAGALFNYGKQDTVLPRIRRKLYKLVKRFNEVLPEPAVGAKRKHTDDDEDKEPKQKRKKVKKTKPTPEAPPESTPKHVAFDLQRNSSQGVQDFVMATPSPYLPNRSPKHGILKVSPGSGATPPSGPAAKRRRKNHPSGAAAAKGGNSMPKGGNSSMAGHSLPGKGNKFADKGRSRQGKAKSSKFASRKKGGRVKRPKRY